MKTQRAKQSRRMRVNGCFIVKCHGQFTVTRPGCYHAIVAEKLSEAVEQARNFNGKG